MELSQDAIEQMNKYVDLFINRALVHLFKSDNQPMKDLLLNRAITAFKKLSKEVKQPLSSNQYNTHLQNCVIEAFYNTFKNEPVYLNTLFSID